MRHGRNVSHYHRPSASRAVLFWIGTGSDRDFIVLFLCVLQNNVIIDLILKNHVRTFRPRRLQR